MKNNTYRILQIAFFVFLFLFLAGCGADAPDGQERTERPTQTTTQSVTREITQTALTEWQSAYKTVIDNILKECGEKYPDEANYGGYGLYDFDEDDVPELFVKVYGTSTSDDYINVYAYDSEKTVLLGGMQASHSWVYGTDRKNTVLLECFASGGESAWSLAEYSDSGFVSEYIVSYFPYGIADIEPEENPLPDMGYEIKTIDFYNLDDMTGIELS